ncbi:MAG: sugar phosphate isomerase/epimerase family protein [Roseimicrobium sp.]
MNTRRHFLKSATLGAAVAAFPKLSNAAPASAGATQFAVFSKHFIGLGYEQLADTLAECGITAIEAPVRPKGGTHVEIAKVADELPKLVEALQKRGIKIAVLTSGINAVAPEQHTESVLRTAAALGIPRFRMDWYAYDFKKPVWSQLEELKPKLKDLVTFSKELGILPCYQNHSGSKNVGAAIWDMDYLMRDYAPSELAWCFDIMHANIEGQLSWPIEVNLVHEHIGVAYFKNVRWTEKGHETAPLGEGVVNKSYVDLLKKLGWSGPVSLHIEYLKGKVKADGYLQEAIAATKRDLAVLKEWWA